MPKVSKTLQQSVGRRSARPGRRNVQLVVPGRQPDADPFDCEILNISASGMLFRSAREFVVGMPFTALFPGDLSVEGMVVWSDDEHYGCKFVSRLSAGVLAAVALKSAPSQPTRPSGSRGDTGNGDTLAERIASLRRNRGMSLDEIAGAVGVTRQAVWYWETGRSKPRASAMRALAQVLGSNESELSATPGKEPTFVRLVREAKAGLARHLGVPPEAIRLVIES